MFSLRLRLPRNMYVQARPARKCMVHFPCRSNRLGNTLYTNIVRITKAAEMQTKIASNLIFLKLKLCSVFARS